MANFDSKGREIPDQTPIAVPIGIQRPLSLHEEIRRFIRSEMSRQAQDEGLESFEEADDFELEEWEVDDMATPYDVPEQEMAPENNESLNGAPSETTPPESPSEAPQEQAAQ